MGALELSQEILRLLFGLWEAILNLLPFFPWPY